MILNNLADWDQKAEAGTLNDSDIVKREEWIMDLHYFYQLERYDLKQKSRVKWAIEGDENTRYFLSLLRNRFANFSIKWIHVNGIWCDNPVLIKEAVMDHFALSFKERIEARPKFSSSLFHRLSPEDASFLDFSFSIDEVKATVWSCSGFKAPGPDGFNFNFIKAYWEVIEADFIKCIKYFESTGNFANGCNPSLIIFIPKSRVPLGFSDYRPISLIGCVYKVISKLLAMRLAKVISSIIGPNQKAFLAGRQILDGNLIANEVIRLAKLEDHKLLFFKVNFEKAFDSVNWVEALQVAMVEACNKGLYKGVHLADDGSNISLLQYADDALFFGKWSRLNARNLIIILKCFEEASGLKVNLAKSKLYGVGVSIEKVEAVASLLCCIHDSIPFTYLGLPVGRKMHFCDGLGEVINRLRDRLTAWKARSLSIRGRLTLIKSVLGSIPIYFLSLFKAPVKVINLLESIRSRFF
ncbi:putative RNA-directed DNA polymerase [Tanacetum coccineum]